MRLAAEEVRAHLVLLRGGAPFLSPADASLLEEWLSSGVPVSQILSALECAAEARRKRRSRRPLTLRHARRHLEKTPVSATPTLSSPSTSSAHVLQRFAKELLQHHASRTEESGIQILSNTLLTLPDHDRDRLVREASKLFRAFLTNQWESLDRQTREDELAKAREELSGLSTHMTESALATAVSEVARDRLRQQYPLLCTTQLWNAISESSLHGGL